MIDWGRKDFVRFGRLLNFLLSFFVLGMLLMLQISAVSKHGFSMASANFEVFILFSVWLDNATSLCLCKTAIVNTITELFIVFSRRCCWLPKIWVLLAIHTRTLMLLKDYNLLVCIFHSDLSMSSISFSISVQHFLLC